MQMAEVSSKGFGNALQKMGLSDATAAESSEKDERKEKQL